MNGALIGLVLAGLLAVAAYGYRMMRAPAVPDRFDETAVQAADAKERRSLFAGLATRLQPYAVDLAGPRIVAYYQHRLAAAGRPENLTAEELLGRKAAFTVVLGAAGLLFALNGSPYIGLGAAVAGFFLQDVWLRGLVTRRQADLERELPDFLDVLSITVEAGLSFQSAFARVTDASSGPLAEEMETTLQQMSLGMPRREALQGLRQRNDSEVLDAFVTALLQAEELGAPLSETLRSMSDDLREQWNQRARRLAAQAVPKVAMVVAFTFVPASMLVIIAGLITGLTGQGGLFG